MPYQRQMVGFKSVLTQQLGTGADTPTDGVRVSRIVKDPRPPKPVWMPEHPHANAQGWVMTPGINMHEEMADYISASRSFEANLAVMKNARAMALAELSIGKR